MPHLHPRSTLFPYTTLFRSHLHVLPLEDAVERGLDLGDERVAGQVAHLGRHLAEDEVADRKSTRLNSSHLGISYAVFCLKKKKSPTSHLAMLPKHDGLRQCT